MINCTGGSDGKESACNAGDPGSITRSARLPREGNGNPLQYSCLKNSMDRGAWEARSQRVIMGSQSLEHDWMTFISLRKGNVDSDF